MKTRGACVHKKGTKYYSPLISLIYKETFYNFFFSASQFLQSKFALTKLLQLELKCGYTLQELLQFILLIKVVTFEPYLKFSRLYFILQRFLHYLFNFHG